MSETPNSRDRGRTADSHADMPAKKTATKTIEGLSDSHPRSIVRFRPADWSPNLIASGLSAEPFVLHYFAIRG